MLYKLSQNLKEQLEKLNNNDKLDVVIELSPSSQLVEGKNFTRQQKIACIQETFNRNVEPVEHVVQEIGGQVNSRAWINQTVLVNVPVGGLDKITKLKAVSALDIPRRLQAEGISLA